MASVAVVCACFARVCVGFAKKCSGCCVCKIFEFPRVKLRHAKFWFVAAVATFFGGVEKLFLTATEFARGLAVFEVERVGREQRAAMQGAK